MPAGLLNAGPEDISQPFKGNKAREHACKPLVLHAEDRRRYGKLGLFHVARGTDAYRKPLPALYKQLFRRHVLADDAAVRGGYYPSLRVRDRYPVEVLEQR